MKPASPQKQLDGFLARYSPEIASLGKAVLGKLRKRLPGAVRMVYDNYNALVVGFGPTERASVAVLSVVLYPRYVSLCFLRGVGLPDPTQRLRGEGKQVRHVRLPDASTLDEPDLQNLITAALERAGTTMATGRGKLIIKSISAAQRPRRAR